MDEESKKESPLSQLEEKVISEIPSEAIPYIGELFSWIGIAWIVALGFGLWGVMIGIGKFGISEFLFVLSGVIVLGKVVVETWRNPTKHRKVICVISALLIIAIEVSVLIWTNSLASEAALQQKRLTQLDQIPSLKDVITGGHSFGYVKPNIGSMKSFRNLGGTNFTGFGGLVRNDGNQP